MKNKLYIFGFALLLWVGTQTSLFLYSDSRAALGKAPGFSYVDDDTLSYLLKIRQIEPCFWQDCPALQSVREQAAAMPKSDFMVSDRLNVRTLHHYFILQAISISAASRILPLSPGSIYFIYKIFTSLLLFFGIYILFYTISESQLSALLAIGLLCAGYYPNLGLHFITPYAFAFAISLIAFALWLSQGKLNKLSSALFALLPWLHLIGIILVLPVLFWEIFKNWRRALSREILIWPLVLSVSLLLLATKFLSRPLMIPSFAPWITEEYWTYTKKGFAHLFEILGQELIWPLNPIFFPTMILCGYFLSEKSVRVKWKKIFLVSFVLLSYSMFSQNKLMFFTISYRFQLYPLLALFSLAGIGIFQSFKHSLNFLKREFPAYQKGILVIAYLAFLTSGLWGRASAFPEAWRQKQSEMNSTMNLMNIDFFKKVSASAEPGESISFQDEYDLQYFLSEGYFANPIQQSTFSNQGQSQGIIVVSGPLQPYDDLPGTAITLAEDSALEVKFNTNLPKKIRLHLENANSEEISLKIQRGEKSLVHRIKKGFTWNELQLPETNDTTLIISVQDSHQHPLFIRGLNSKNDSYFWQWNEIEHMQWKKQNNQVVHFNFRISKILEGLRYKRYEVIADGPSNLALRVWH